MDKVSTEIQGLSRTDCNFQGLSSCVRTLPLDISSPQACIEMDLIYYDVLKLLKPVNAKYTILLSTVITCFKAHFLFHLQATLDMSPSINFISPPKTLYVNGYYIKPGTYKQQFTVCHNNLIKGIEMLMETFHSPSKCSSLSCFFFSCASLFRASSRSRVKSAAFFLGFLSS